MRQAARVLSTDALRDLRSALARFSARARDGLRSALLEVHHTLDWLDKQLDAWRREAEKRHETVLRCRSELAVVRSAPENLRSAATEREIDLRKAMARLQGGRGKGRGRTPLETDAAADSERTRIADAPAERLPRRRRSIRAGRSRQQDREFAGLHGLGGARSAGRRLIAFAGPGRSDEFHGEQP